MKKEVIKISKKCLNKLLNKSIAFSLLTVVFLSAFTIFPYADSNAIINIEDKTYIEHHFELAGWNHSSNNFLIPENVEGSCGYVAMSMLLSYYDSYWHEDFVPNNLELGFGEYNQNNHSIEKEVNARLENQRFNNECDIDDQYTYTDFVDEYHNAYLHPHLINMDRYHNALLLLPNFFGIMDGTLKETLSNYLYNECHFTQDQITVRMMTEAQYGDAALFNEMKQQINNGNPVIYFGAKFVFDPSTTTVEEWLDAGAHFMIAYDVEVRDGVEDIKLNSGYNGSISKKTFYVNDCQYNLLNSIIWLEINESNLPHECTQNYLNMNSGERVCTCEMYASTHPEHTTHNYYWERYDEVYHWTECACGDRILKDEHDMSYYPNVSGLTHYEECNECSYAQIVDHDYSACIKISETQHETYCLCGVYGGTEAHYAYRYTKYNNSLHTTHCKCGKTWTEPHVVSSDAYDSGNRLAPCLACGVLVTAGTTLHPTMNGLLRTENGSFILPDGIIVLVDEDIEAYFAGTLEFYYPDDNLETE